MAGTPSPSNQVCLHYCGVVVELAYLANQGSHRHLPTGPLILSVPAYASQLMELTAFFLDEVNSGKLPATAPACWARHFATVNIGQLTCDQVRSLLAALLTVRDPLPIPVAVMLQLDELLATESASRTVVAPATLPTLAAQGIAGGVFGERVRLWRGDITALHADAIVNAANEQLLGCRLPEHACVDNAIHDVAGPGLRAECAAHMTRQGHREAIGRAAVTGGYHLPARAVIHTVGPTVSAGSPSSSDEAALVSSYRAVLAAMQPGWRTIGLCAISTGTFAYPKEAAAQVAVRAVADFLATHDTPIEPVFVVYSLADHNAYLDAISKEVAP